MNVRENTKMYNGPAGVFYNDHEDEIFTLTDKQFHMYHVRGNLCETVYTYTLTTPCGSHPLTTIPKSQFTKDILLLEETP